MFELEAKTLFLIDRRVSSKVIRPNVNCIAWFNEGCANEFHNKQNAYHFWLQN